MKPFTVTRTIRATPEAIYAYIVDVANFPAWVPGLRRIDAPPHPVAVGTAVKMRINGLSSTCTFVTLTPEQRIAYDITSIFGLIQVRIDMAPRDAQVTEVTKGHTIAPSRLGRLLGPLLERTLAQQVTTEIDTIKRHVEG